MIQPISVSQPERRIRRRVLFRIGMLLTAARLLPPKHVQGQQGTATQGTQKMTSNSRLFSFVGGATGPWKVVQQFSICGDPLGAIERLQYVSGEADPSLTGVDWILRGVTSNERYTTREEKDALVANQAALGRNDADFGVLIPIRKNPDWWKLTQDERRKIFEADSHHNAIGMEYLPAIARRLHHCRDLDEQQPYDFLTWFDFSRKDLPAFERLLERLRGTEEWKYIDRESEIRVTRDLAS